tara:strand:+ start:380 stop:511 length:132 start_codon:yes stop_codon:yes gene_type:complete
MSLKTGMFLPGYFCQKASFQTAADDRTNDQKKRLTGMARRSKE